MSAHFENGNRQGQGHRKNEAPGQRPRLLLARVLVVRERAFALARLIAGG